MVKSPGLLRIRDLCVQAGASRILNGVSLDIPPGSIVGIVGGSGSGKTTLALSILGLLPAAMRLTGGTMEFEQVSLNGLAARALQELRGRKIGMVFQEPLTAFDPLFTIGEQLDETLVAHTNFNALARRDRILRLLRHVEMMDAERIYASYPHQLSGGLRQRAMMAQALVCAPKLVIADEPTSSLDVTIQAKIIQLLRKLNTQDKLAFLLISHDLGMVGHLADTIAVMTEGRIVETGPAKEILSRPRHAYTKALLEAY